MAIGTGAAILGSAVLGGALSKRAGDKAVRAQQDSARSADEIAQRQFDQIRADNAGTRDRGDAAGNMLAQYLGLTVPDSSRSAAPAAAGGGFDGAAYLAQNPDVAASGMNPFQHYQMYGKAEGRPGTFMADAATAAPRANMLPSAQFGSLLKPFEMGDLENDAGYQFQLQQGNKALTNNAASRGNLYSGATLKAAQRFGQGLAANSFNDAFNRDQTQKNAIYNRLAGVAGTGQVATNNVGAAGQQFAQTAGQNAIGMGNARAGNTLSNNQNWLNALNQGTASWLRYNKTAGGGGGLSGMDNSSLDDFINGRP